MRCKGIKRNFQQCNYNACEDSIYCKIHYHTVANDSRNTEYLNLCEKQHVLLKELSEKNKELTKLWYHEMDKNDSLLTRLDDMSKLLDEDEKYISKLLLKIRLNDNRNVIDNTDTSSDCCICYDKLSKSVLTSCCSTEICMSCLEKWSSINQNCPMCREEL